MKVRATWEFDVDTSEWDPQYIDVPGLAKDLAKNELVYSMLHSARVTADDFEYEVETPCNYCRAAYRTNKSFQVTTPQGTLDCVFEYCPSCGRKLAELKW